MRQPKKRNTWTGLAIILVVVGSALLLSNAGPFVPRGLPHLLRTYWPCVIIGIGISKLLPEKDRRLTEGLVYLGIGTFFQLMMLDWVPGGFASLWPVASIMFGLWVYFGGTASDDRIDRSLITDNNFELDELFSSRNVTISDHRAQAGKVTLTFAGLTMHITPEEPPPELLVHVDSWCSSLTLRVPPDWAVDMQAGMLVSRLRDKRTRPVDASPATKRIALQGALHFSTVEIQHPKIKPGTTASRRSSGNHPPKYTLKRTRP
jgi:hypothetical protein